MTQYLMLIKWFCLHLMVNLTRYLLFLVHSGSFKVTSASLGFFKYSIMSAARADASLTMLHDDQMGSDKKSSIKVEFFTG